LLPEQTDGRTILDGLGINPELLIAQIINFLLLFGLLYAAAYKPVLKMLDKRAKGIQESIDKAESLMTQASEAEQEAQRQLDDAGKAGQNLISKAVVSAETIRGKALEDAKPEVEAFVTRARQTIQEERKEVMEELKKEFSDLTITAARKVIEAELDENKHRKLIEKVLEESALGKQDRSG